MRVRFATAAKRDLRDIALRIADDNVPRSITFVEEVQERCRTLAQHPERFPEAARFRGKALHKMTHGSYLVFYVAGPSDVEIVRIVHSARDWPSIFADD